MFHGQSLTRGHAYASSLIDVVRDEHEADDLLVEVSATNEKSAASDATSGPWRCARTPPTRVARIPSCPTRPRCRAGAPYAPRAASDADVEGAEGDARLADACAPPTARRRSGTANWVAGRESSIRAGPGLSVVPGGLDEAPVEGWVPGRHDRPGGSSNPSTSSPHSWFMEGLTGTADRSRRFRSASQASAARRRLRADLGVVGAVEEAEEADAGRRGGGCASGSRSRRCDPSALPSRRATKRARSASAVERVAAAVERVADHRAERRDPLLSAPGRAAARGRRRTLRRRGVPPPARRASVTSARSSRWVRPRPVHSRHDLRAARSTSRTMISGARLDPGPERRHALAGRAPPARLQNASSCSYPPGRAAPYALGVPRIE
jgi:hypothetical protein